MTAIVDIGKVLNAWQQQLDFHRKKVKEYELKVATLNEATSLSGKNIKDHDNPEVIQSQLGSSELSLPKSVVKILKINGGWLSTQELYDELMANGFKSSSKNFILLLSNTLQKMSKAGGKLEKRKEEDGRNVKFALAKELFDKKD